MVDHIVNFAESIIVYDTGFTKERIGREEDGGYVVCYKSCEDSEILYSYGISDDWSFEEHFCARFNCSGRLFDHTVDLENKSNQKIIFKKEGLSSIKTEVANTFQAHILENGHSDKKIALKLDIEWNEWDFFESVPDSFLKNITHIICEFHLIPVEYTEGNHSKYFTEFHKDVYDGVNQLLFKRYTEVFQKIARYFTLHHVHVNNSLGSFEHKGAKIPNLLECSFINSNYCSDFFETKEDFPIPGLDFPNKTYKEDVKNFYPLINAK